MTHCSWSCEANTPKTDLKKPKPPLKKHKTVPGSLITVLQRIQDIYVCLRKDVTYAVAKAINAKLLVLHAFA